MKNKDLEIKYLKEEIRQNKEYQFTLLCRKREIVSGYIDLIKRRGIDINVRVFQGGISPFREKRVNIRVVNKLIPCILVEDKDRNKLIQIPIESITEMGADTDGTLVIRCLDSKYY